MFVCAASVKSAAELARLQSGLAAPAAWPFAAYLPWFFLALALLVALATAVTRFRKKRHGPLLQTAITDPQLIAATLTRAVARQANCSLEIFGRQHSGLLSGRVYEAAPGRLVLELSRLPGQGADFADLPAQVHLNFRPTPQEEMEHYQFSTRTLELGYQREKNWRTARLTVAWPGSLISAQRRDFLRLEPAGEQALRVQLWLAPTEGGPAQFEKTRPLATASVLDLSVGGAQLLLPGRRSFPEGRDLALLVDLPSTGLDLELSESRLWLLFTPISEDVLAAASTSPRTVLRGRFSGRYRFDPDTQNWRRLGFSPQTFQDLALWLHAYQRLLLKKEKGLLAAPPERVNVYSAKPPERPSLKD